MENRMEVSQQKPKTYNQLVLDNAILKKKNRNRKDSLHKLQAAYDRLLALYENNLTELTAYRKVIRNG